MQSVFQSGDFGCKATMNKSIVLFKGRKNGENKLWVAKVLPLFRVEMRGVASEREEEEFAFLQYMELVN